MQTNSFNSHKEPKQKYLREKREFREKQRVFVNLSIFMYMQKSIIGDFTTGGVKFPISLFFPQTENLDKENTLCQNMENATNRKII
jgi:hypothetical protein